MPKTAPVLNHFNLVTKDFDASLKFYRCLGVEMPDGAPSPEGIRHSEAHQLNGLTLALDNDTLARVYNAAWRRPQGSSRAVIGFSVPTREDVDEHYAAVMAAGYEGRQPPYDTFWGSRYAVVADPDGHDVGIMSPPDPARATWPPTDSPS